MVTVRLIEKNEKITIQSEPFLLFGRLIPLYDGTVWKSKIEIYPKEKWTTMCFPEENYDPSDDQRNFIGAFKDGQCIGLAVLADGDFQYMYLDNIMVSKAYRQQGIGTRLIDQCKKLAVEKKYLGIYTIAQDNNLGACLFYQKYGFEIGGLDTRVYYGTSQENKKDIYFYYTID